MRSITSMNQGWKFSKTNEIPSSLPASWQDINLPHTWNNLDGQDGGNDYWRGTACYMKAFKRPEMRDGQCLFVEFKGAAYTAEVWCNGRKLGHHEDGFSTFRVELTDVLQDDNLLAVTVDNSANERVYPQTADFTFFGGIYRDVNFIVTEKEHFELVKDGQPGVHITSIVEGDNARIQADAVCCAGDQVTFTIGSLCMSAVVKDGNAHAEGIIEHVHLWDGLADPYLYEAHAVLSSNGTDQDSIDVRFGVRTMEIDAQKGFILNGRSYPLRGVSRHQDRLNKGNAISYQDMKDDMEVIKDIGANSVRLAHYQHDSYFYDLCDENGIVVWAEIPYITRHMPDGDANTQMMLEEMIEQLYNHPSIAVWGLSNEITASGAVNEDLIENHQALNALAHELDPYRPTAMAHVFMLETDSALTEISDVGAYNLYYGWYLGELDENGTFFDEYHQKFPERAIGFTEYGADANSALHSGHCERGDYSEEYQCVYHEALLKCIEERPYLWCSYVWNLFDFAADGRTEGSQAGKNQKGLVQYDHESRKDAFYLYKAAWSKQPFVHLCGRRYVNRNESTTKIKVYSNQDTVTLYCDGERIGEQKGSRVFEFEVKINGIHQIKAVSGALEDQMEIKYTETADQSYTIASSGGIVNWFEKDDFKPDYYSIKDTMGALQSNPATAVILQKIIAKAAASRGDVAKASENNANLQKMMAKMSLESMLKSAGEKAVPKEAVKALNAALQKVHK